MRQPITLQHSFLFGAHITNALHIVCSRCDSLNRVPRERMRQRGKCGSCYRPFYEGRSAALHSYARFDKYANHSDIPLLLDFWTDRCGPCRAMVPIFERAATEPEPDVRLINVDSDATPELLQRFSIQSIPTLMIVHRGREVAQIGRDAVASTSGVDREHADALKRDRTSVDFRLITSRAIWTAIPSQTSAGSSFHRGGE